MRHRLWVVVCIVAALACNRQSAGTFSVHFSWNGAKPAAFSGWATMRVEQRLGDPNAAGQVLSTAGPVPFAPGAALAFDKVPNANHLVVVAELRAAESTSAPVLYYGVSDLFVLSAGKSVVVDVRLQLSPPPAATVTTAGDISKSAIAFANAAALTRDANIVLNLLSNTGVQVKIANSLDFAAASSQTIPLSTLQAGTGAPAGYMAYAAPWNLGLGTDLTCATAHGCTRTVYAQFIDVAGYASETATASIVLDNVAPGVLSGATQVSPAYASASVPVVITVVTNEPVVGVPVLSVGGQTGLFDLSAANGNTTFSFVSHGLAGSTWTDGTYAVQAALTDIAGNSATVAVGSFVVDSTPPSLLAANSNVTPSFLAAGATMQVVFTASEPLATVPQVRVGSLPLTGCQQSSSLTTQYTCTHVVDTSEGEGAKTITVQMADAAGNLNTAALATVSYDFTPPALAFTQLTPPLAITQSSVLLSMTFTEPLGADPQITATPTLPGTTGFALLAGSTGTSYDYAYTTPSLGADGNFVLSVVAQDVAGNVSGALALSSLSLDLTVPVISNVTVTPPASVNLQDIANGRILGVQFTVSEAQQSGAPLVTVGSSTATCVAAGLDYNCTFLAASEPDGEQAVEIVAIDVAGNTSINANQTIVYDLTDPTGVFSANPNLVAANATVALVYQASKPLNAAPTLTVTRPDASDASAQFGTASVQGTTYTWRYTLQSGDLNGAWNANLRQIADVNGNPGTDANTKFVVDQQLPTVSASSVAPALAKAGTVVTATFTTSKAQRSGFPTLSIGGVAVPIAPTGNPNEYSGSYTATTGNDGSKAVQVYLTDTSGNTNLANLTPITVDTALALGTASATPAVAGTGATLSVLYVAGETLQTTPTLSVTLPSGSSGTSLFGSPTISGQAYSWSYALQPGDGSGTWHYSIGNLQDVAGNVGGPLQFTNAVDQNAPSITSVASLTGVPVAVGAPVTTQFVVSKALASTPTVLVGSTPMTLSSQNGLTYNFVHTVGLSEGEGIKSVVASLVDAAGNNAVSALGTVTYDFTPPAVAAALVAYQPAAANPLPTAQQATVGTIMRVTVAADEALNGTTPSLTASSGSSALSFAVASASDLEVVFQATVPGGVQDGNYVPAVSWCDVAGNCTTTATFDPPLLEVNTSVPVAASINAALLEQLRIPQGAFQNNYVAGQYVVALGLNPNTDPATQNLPSGALVQPSGEALAMVRAYSTAGFLGSSTWSGGAWSPLSLVGSDSATLWLTAVDNAGNESTQVPLTHVEWVASTHALLPGDTVVNPHRFEARSLDWQVLAQAANAMVGDSNGIGAANDGNVFSSASGGFYRQRFTGQGPSASGPMVNDSAHGITYVFADTTAGAKSGALPSSYTDFVAWENQTWVAISAADPQNDGNPTPPTLYAGALTYDVARNRVVLYQETDAQVSETWEFDGVSWQHMLPSTSPPPRSGARLVYDSNNQVSVLLGGQLPSSAYVNDMWTWDGNAWLSVSTTNTPTPRANFGLAYDSARSVTVLQGGVGSTANCDGSGSTTCSGTYELAGTTWTAIAATGQSPGACANQGMAFDAVRAKVVQFGGQNGSGAACGSSVWEYDASGWITCDPADPDADGNPPASTYAQGQLAYDITMGAALSVAPGVTANANDGTLWSWDGMSWLQVQPNVVSNGSFYYPPARWLLTGDVSSGIYAGKSMLAGSLPYAVPSNYATTVPLAYDVNNNLILFPNLDGSGCSAYKWSPVTGYACASGATGPGPRCYTTFVFDANRSVAVMFGGSYICQGTNLSDLWEYNDTALSWSEPCSTCPANYYNGQAIAYDPNVKKIFIGSTYDPNLWEWDGGTWHGTSLGQTTIGGISYDPILGSTYIFTGYGTDAPVFRWNGSTAVPVPSIEPFGVVPTGTFTAPFNYASGTLGLWDQGYTYTPAHVFRVNLAALNLPSGTTAAYNQMSVNWWAGANGTAYQSRRSVRVLDGNQTVASPYTFNATNTPTLARLDGIDGATPVHVSVQGNLGGATWQQVCITGTGVNAPPACAVPSQAQVGTTYWTDVPFVLGSAGTPLSHLAVTFSESSGTMTNTTIEIIADPLLRSSASGAALSYFDTRGWQQVATQAGGGGATSRMTWGTSTPNDISRAVIEDQYVYVRAAAEQAGQITTDAAEVRLSFTTQ